MLLENLPSKEVAGEAFDTIKNNNFTSIATINVELTGKLVRRLHLCPLLWLQEKVVFNANITGNTQAIVLTKKELKSQARAKNLLMNRTRRLSKGKQN